MNWWLTLGVESGGSSSTTAANGVPNRASSFGIGSFVGRLQLGPSLVAYFKLPLLA